MLNIQSLRQIKASIICIGSHKPIIQSMLDFDYLSGKAEPSIKGIIASGRHIERYFFGKKEILIPVFSDIQHIPDNIKKEINLFFNTSSARRAKQTTIDVFQTFPNLLGGTIFAEDLPEQHTIELSYFISHYQKTRQLENQTTSFIVGPSSVGLLIPDSFKLGAIGGTDYRQLLTSDVMTPGNVAVLSASGGMVGEIIRIVAQKGYHLSFSLSFGGDRFPILSPKDAFLAAEGDPQTQAIVYYGELGGTDEYEIVELIKHKQLTKQVICYIAGTVSDLFETPPQFGHAKAMAKNKGESAREKRDALKNVGVKVAETFEEFVHLITHLHHPHPDLLPSKEKEEQKYSTFVLQMAQRKHALITSTISRDDNGEVKLLNQDLLTFAKKHSFAHNVVSMFLGKQIQSEKLVVFVDLVLKLAIDHGPHVSGAMNSIITARAGRDLVSSLSAGLLTIGPRFGGAINQAATNWLRGVTTNGTAYDFVESFASQKVYIAGIGHKKYRVDAPDPRVSALLAHTEELETKRFSSFALEVEKITSAKKGNLILNVDGAIAAIMLDILSEREFYSDSELKKLTNIEFFNTFFVLSRSVGFIAHFLDQKRLDEGLFRLPDDLVTSLEE